LPSISLTLNMSSTSALILMNIACMDPIIHGSDVYQARAILDVDGSCSTARSMTFLGEEEQDQSTLLEKETLNDVQIQVVPNPNNGSFRLQTNVEFFGIKVYNLAGILVYSKFSELESLVTSLKAGIYLVHVLTKANQIKVLKIEVY
jgi:Secretion system C-terminal sorting domain